MKNMMMLKNASALMARALSGALDGGRAGAGVGRRLNTAARDVGTGGAFLRHGSTADDGARELAGLSGELGQDAAEMSELMEQLVLAARQRAARRRNDFARDVLQSD